MTRARWVLTTAMVPLVAVATSLSPTVHGTSARFTGAMVSGQNAVAGASFVPQVAPVVQQSTHGQNVALTWQPVAVSGGATVSYVVTRTRAGISTVVCTGADAPVLSSGMMTCTDRKPGSGTITYTEQPVVIRSGQVTWSLPPSTPT